MVAVRCTYKYRLYTNRNRHLHATINVAGIIWNHGIALHRRYYRITGKHLNQYQLMKHLAKLRRSNRYHYWQWVGSQAVQDIAQRIEKAYQQFFTKQGGRPSFQNVRKYRSFTLKQAGWQLLDRNRIRIGKQTYKYVKSREIDGEIKTVTVKRDRLGRLWLCFSVKQAINPNRISTGEIGGLDFGLKIFLTDHEGNRYLSAEYLKHDLAQLQRLNRSLSSKGKGSNNRHKARMALAKAHECIANKRRDAHFKLAHELCHRFDVTCLEDLHIKAMHQRWGRKVGDLGFAEFVGTLKHVATKRGVQIIQVDRYEPTTKVCSDCGQVQELTLSERVFQCQGCGLVLDRDHNAARNIRRVGASTLGLGDVRLPSEAVTV